MIITVDRLFQDALLLSDESRLKLAEQIVESVEPDESLLRHQLAESTRRAAEMESGAVKGIPLSDALEHIRSFRARHQTV